MAVSRSLRWLALLFVLLVPLAVFHGCGDEDDPVGPGDEDVVGPDGGTLTFEDGAVSLAFPANAVDAELQVTVSPTTGPAHGLVVPGTVYDLGPDGTTFDTPVTLTLAYDPEALPEGVRESELRVFRAEGGAWVEAEPSSVDPGANTAAAELDAFSVYGVLGLPVASVSVDPGSPTVEVGGTVQLEAMIEAASGVELPDRGVEWESSDPDFAEVSSAGAVTGVSAGSATITATSEGVEGTAAVTIVEPVAEVVVEPEAAELGVGETVTLTATPMAGDGTPLDREVSWESSEETVATVDSDGVVTAQDEGSATITATSEGVEGTAEITVINPVASVEVVADVQGIVAGGTTELDVTARNGAGEVLEDPEVTWSTSDEGVVTIDDDGVVTAVAPGVATLTASVGGVEDSVELTVTIDWTEFAGDWSGTWTNTTFGSSDAIDATVTIDVANLTATMIIDVDGPVLGASDPMPMTVMGTLTPTTMQVDHEAPLHGRIVFNLAPGDFEIESIEVPASGFQSWTYTGTTTTTTHSASFTVTFDGGSTAEGVVEVTKQ